MVLTERPSPSRVSAVAATALPRWALFALLIAYCAAGLWGRDPWYGDDAAGFGLMWTMAHGSAADWWLPNIAGLPIAEEGPLPFWLGAALIRVAGPLLGEPLAARLSCVLWFALATSMLWYATYQLGRRREAQPIAFVFGGEAHPVDYGRLLADSALLLFIGTLGIVERAHETTAETAAIAFVCAALLGLAWLPERARIGAAIAGVAIGALALTRGPYAAISVLIPALVIATLFAPRARRAGAVAILSLLSVFVFSLWPLASLSLPAAARSEFYAAWWAWSFDAFGLPAKADLVWIASNVAWYCWPLWPLVLWTIYAWRHQFRAPHIAAPGLVLLATLLALAGSRPVADSSLILCVPSMVVLAAFGSATLRRAAGNGLDWFAIATFSLIALAAWAYFIALETGVPPRMAASVERLVPGFDRTTSVLAVSLALAVTLGWIALVAWRIVRRPAMLWRGPLLAGAGFLTLWLLAVLLFLPAVNYNRSYAPIAHEIAARIKETAGADACVEPYFLYPSHRAMLAYHGAIRFQRPGEAECPLLLHRDSRRTHLDDEPPPGEWQVIWEGRWPARPDELLRLYRRAPH